MCRFILLLVQILLSTSVRCCPLGCLVPRAVMGSASHSHSPSDSTSSGFLMPVWEPTACHQRNRLYRVKGNGKKKQIKKKKPKTKATHKPNNHKQKPHLSAFTCQPVLLSFSRHYRDASLGKNASISLLLLVQVPPGSS